MRLGSIFQERLDRLRTRRSDDAALAAEVESRTARLAESFSGQAVEEALTFAKRTSYAHPGLSALGYLVHPLRVAEMLMYAGGSEAGIVIALLHNIIEVGDVDARGVEEKFGPVVSKGVEVLTVDRTRQGLPEYREAYYRRISMAGGDVPLIKVLDKLDNLFLLCLNDDAGVREGYLREIERNVQPLIPEGMRDLSEYVARLTEDCRHVGHLGDSEIRDMCAGKGSR